MAIVTTRHNRCIFFLGGKDAGYKSMTVRHEGDVHWYLVHVPTGLIIDPTVSQFRKPPPYKLGRGRGFLTSQPSKKAKVLMDLLVWQHVG